jgi:DNA-binding response OmpR family regulator
MISYILKKDKDVEILKYTSREEYFNDKDTILDLLVLDHTLNDLNGLTGLDVLKEIRETDISTPIIVLSNQKILRWFWYIVGGANDYIVKSPDSLELLYKEVTNIKTDQPYQELRKSNKILYSLTIIGIIYIIS